MPPETALRPGQFDQAVPISQPVEEEPPKDVDPTPEIIPQPNVGAPTGNVLIQSDALAEDATKQNEVDLAKISEGLELARVQAEEIKATVDARVEQEDREKEVKAQGGLTFEEAQEAFGTDFTGIQQDPTTGLFVPDETALARIDPQAKATIEANNKIDEEEQRIKDNTEKRLAFASTAEKLAIQSINDSYSRRAEILKDINNRSLEGLRILGIRSGRQRFAPEIQTGLLTASEREGQQQLNNLESERLNLIARAELAADEKEFAILNQEFEALRENERARAKVAETLRIEAKEQEDKALASARKISIENSIIGLVEQGVTSPAQLFDFLNRDEQGNLTGDISLEDITGTLEKITDERVIRKLTGDAEDFQSFVDIGLINTSLPINEQWKQYLDIAKEDKLLSVTEAEKLGVPFGTTESEAFGRFAIEDTIKEAGPPSSSQFQAGTFAKRMEQAENELSGGRGFFTPFAPKFLRTEDRRLFEQAERNYINALLRRESGAAIADTEFDSARQQYIPIASDSQAVLDAKAQNREIVFEGLKAESGNAFDIIGGQVGGFNAFDISEEEQELLDAGFTPEQIEEVKNAP